METNIIEAASGTTTKPDGSLKEMSDDQLKAAQSARSKVSGISAKNGGSLTMPAKWRGKASDNNNTWGDWTNYSFPLVDKAHADNAAARLAQNTGYSSEEKAKIGKRIENAQKKFGEKKVKSIELDNSVFQKNDFKKILADAMPADQGKDYFTKSEVIDLLNRVCGMMYENLDGAVEYLMNKQSSVVSQANEYMEYHAEGHMPKLDISQVKSVLRSAGIADQFEDRKQPIVEDPGCIYASGLKDLKIEVK